MNFSIYLLIYQVVGVLLEQLRTNELKSSIFSVQFIVLELNHTLKSTSN